MNQKNMKDMKVGEMQEQEIRLPSGETKKIKVKKIGDKNNKVPASEMLKGSKAAADTATETDK